MKKTLLLSLAIIFLSGIAYGQNLIRVNNNPNFDADYTNLQDANDHASNGDTIYIEGSATSYDGADISKSVTIIGPGYFLSENDTTQANGLEAKFNGNINFNTGSEGSIITGCRISNYTNLYINTNDISVIRCYLYSISFSNSPDNILIHQNYIANDIGLNNHNTITNSIISNNISGQVYLSSSSGNVLIANNVITSYYINCYNSTIQNNIITTGQISENTGNSITNNILSGSGTNANGNQYSVDMSTVFVDFDGSLNYSTDGKWQLKTGSPAIGAGIGGVDCGAFGGTVPYVLSGLPMLPHIYEASIPVTVNSQDGLSVTIKVMSGQ